MIQRIGPARLRRALLVVCVALIALAVLMVFTLPLSETRGGSVELIGGRQDTSALAVPLALFVVGAAGLLAALGWRPE